MQNQSAAADFFTLPDTFIIREHIGSEDRSTEFKKGPGFIDHDFRKNVAKYVSAFINSQQNGKLLIGVDDDGSVVGYGINQGQEDRLKQQIDDAIKDIRPAVHPNDYRVAFIPVVDNWGLFIEIPSRECTTEK
ncbi:schlafen-like protein 1 [Dreissena polymorpha]|uniref:schlafen-like protein 1 n=1 Tax=Dreissena polymorpha TaxID=45954 RepID=UPI002264EF47|nr:schlafen-like protein 1 [Dreissena polymorpha]